MIPGLLRREAAAATPSPCHSRLIPVWQPAPIHPSIRHHVRLSGSVAVVGSHPLAARLARELELTGAKVRLFTGQDASVEAWMESQLANGPLPHLCLVGLDATLAGVDSNREQFEATCGRQFRLTRIWYAALKEKCRFDAASLMVVTSRCGPGNQPEAMEPAAAAMRGLAKAVSMESMAAGQPGIATRFIELCEADLDSQVERVLGEWARGASSHRHRRSQRMSTPPGQCGSPDKRPLERTLSDIEPVRRKPFTPMRPVVLGWSAAGRRELVWNPQSHWRSDSDFHFTSWGERRYPTTTTSSGVTSRSRSINPR